MSITTETLKQSFGDDYDQPQVIFIDQMDCYNYEDDFHELIKALIAFRNKNKALTIEYDKCLRWYATRLETPEERDARVNEYIKVLFDRDVQRAKSEREKRLALYEELKKEFEK